MALSTLDSAKYLMKCRKFSSALAFLEQCEDTYEDDFDYYVTRGIANLYAGTPSEASPWFNRARQIKLLDAKLLLGQAVIYLGRGQTDRALEFYLQILDIDPNNQTAKDAMEFIRRDGSWDSICRMKDTGDIRKFYPPLGINPMLIRNCLGLGFLLGILVSAVILLQPHVKTFLEKHAEAKEAFSLTAEELKNPLQNAGEVGEFSLTLSASQVRDAYAEAKRLFTLGRDNGAHHLLNKVIASNASLSVKQKAQTMIDLLKEPTFDNLKDNFTLKEISEEPVLYLDCYVCWDGMIMNSRTLVDGSWAFDLLVNYVPESGKNVSEGLVTVIFDKKVEPAVDEKNPVRILGRVSTKDKNIILKGAAVHQHIKGGSL